MKRAGLTTLLALLLPTALLGGALVQMGSLNLGQLLCWLAFFSSLVAAAGYWFVGQGRAGALDVATTAFRLQWAALLGGAVFLWWILFNHQFQFQYVASYSSRAMPGHFVYAAFWGGQEGTFLLWGLITACMGLIVMRWKHSLQPYTMFFLNLPLVMLTLVGVMRGPFLTFAAAQVPVDGQGLNPLLQDYWMTIHPPVLFIGFSSFVVPFAIACAALMKRDYDGWVKPVLPWAVFSTAIQATGFIMGGVWAYKVLGWGGYWGWDPVENGSLIPWLSNIALVHGLLIQRATGSLRRTNFFLAILSYVLVLYASFLTRSGVLADFSVHSFANLGLSGFLLSFLAVAGVVGFGLLLSRIREIPAPSQPLGNFSRESFMWLGQLVFMLMCALVTIGMSAPLFTKLFGPPTNVRTEFYNLVNAPLAVAMGLLMGVTPLLRWRQHEADSLLKSVAPAFVFALLLTSGVMLWGVRDALPLLVVFAMGFAMASNVVVTLKGFKSGWKHGIAYLGHLGVTVLLIGVVLSSGYGRNAQVQLPKGQQRNALGFKLVYQGMVHGKDGKDAAVIAVVAPEKSYTANAHFYWSDFNQGYMKNPHIERFWSHDVYISPLEMVGDKPGDGGIWFAKGESKKVGAVTYTFENFTPMPENGRMKLIANLTAEIGGRTVPLKPVFEIVMGTGEQSRTPDYIPGGGQVSILTADPNNGGRVSLSLPGAEKSDNAEILAVELSTKPFINLVWLGAILTLGATFAVVVRRGQDVAKDTPKAV